MKIHAQWHNSPWRELARKMPLPDADSTGHDPDPTDGDSVRVLLLAAVNLILGQPPQYFGLNFPRAYESATEAWRQVFGDEREGEATFGEFWAAARANYAQSVAAAMMAAAQKFRRQATD